MLHMRNLNGHFLKKIMVLAFYLTFKLNISTALCTCSLNLTSNLSIHVYQKSTSDELGH